MESTSRPTPGEAQHLIDEAGAGRDGLARQVVVPARTHLWLGLAVAFQLLAAATGIASPTPRGVGFVLLGVLVVAVVAAVQLVRFRRANGVRLAGFGSKVLLGTATQTSVGYAVAMAATYAASVRDLWWLSTLCALAGGAAYGLGGRQWMRAYRRDPATHAVGESALFLATVAALAVVGVALLVAGR